jgi:hypothetical protein
MALVSGGRGANLWHGGIATLGLAGKSGAAMLRSFFLFSDILIYAQEKKKSYMYKGSINLFPSKYNLCVEDLPLHSASFSGALSLLSALRQGVDDVLTPQHTRTHTTEKFSFQLVGRMKPLLVLTARTQQDKDNWMRELNNALNVEEKSKSGGMCRLHRAKPSHLSRQSCD